MPDLSALTRLEILYLHDNALTALPALPPSLTYLNISENPLRASSCWVTCRALIELRLLDLGLDGAAARSRCPRLRELHLRTQRVHRGAGGACGRLRELRLLDLRANRLTSVPDWIVELPRLEKLDLRWNEVFEYPLNRRRGLRERGCVVLVD